MGYLQKVVTMEHYHLMGKLLFAFTVFWAYIAFDQFFLIWYANITEETKFFLIRNSGGWWWISLLLVFGHFGIPFLILLQAWLKKRPTLISAVAVWVLLMHAVDLYWIIIPERGVSVMGPDKIGQLAPGGIFLDLLAFISLTSLSAWFFIRNLGQHSLYPWRDPRLQESIDVSN